MDSIMPLFPSSDAPSTAADRRECREAFCMRVGTPWTRSARSMGAGCTRRVTERSPEAKLALSAPACKHASVVHHAPHRHTTGLHQIIREDADSKGACGISPCGNLRIKRRGVPIS